MVKIPRKWSRFSGHKGVLSFPKFSKAKSETFVPDIIPSTWEASTLPLSYTRSNPNSNPG